MSSKGETTRRRIVERAVEASAREGLRALSIGQLAGQLGMSKSGLFQHFGSIDMLQVASVDEIRRQFIASVVEPSLQERRGQARLAALVRNWFAWARAHGACGCPLASAAFEFDALDGPAHDRVVEAFLEWRHWLEATIEEGKQTDIPEKRDPAATAFAIMAAYLAHHLYRTLLGERDAGRMAESLLRAALGDECFTLT